MFRQTSQAWTDMFLQSLLNVSARSEEYRQFANLTSRKDQRKCQRSVMESWRIYPDCREFLSASRQKMAAEVQEHWRCSSLAKIDCKNRSSKLETHECLDIWKKTSIKYVTASTQHQTHRKHVWKFARKECLYVRTSCIGGHHHNAPSQCKLQIRQCNCIRETPTLQCCP